MMGFSGILVVNAVLWFGYTDIKNEMMPAFVALYIVQLSFQSFPGVTTMAIPADIYPSAVKGTGSAVSAASGKVGAFVGSFLMTWLKDNDLIQEIFEVVACIGCAALVITVFLTPYYNGATLRAAERCFVEGNPKEAVTILYGGPRAEDDEDVNPNQNKCVGNSFEDR